MVSAINLDTEMGQGDVMYLVDVRCADEPPVLNNISPDSVRADTSLQSILTSYNDRFPDELPAELPPVRNVYHTIPLKNNDPPPPRVLLSKKLLTLAGPLG